MRKFAIFLSLICFTWLLTSCSSPKSNAQAFLEALNTSQFDTALSLVTKDSEPILYDLISRQNKDIPRVHIQVKNCIEISADGDEVRCIYDISNEADEHFEKTITLVKEDYKWKVDLTQH